MSKPSDSKDKESDNRTRCPGKKPGKKCSSFMRENSPHDKCRKCRDCSPTHPCVLCVDKDSSHWDALAKRSKRRPKDDTHSKTKGSGRTHSKSKKSKQDVEQPSSDVTHISDSSKEGDSRPSDRQSGSKYPKGNTKPDPASGLGGPNTVSRGASSEVSPLSVHTIADFPTDGSDFSCIDDDGNTWHFRASDDIITYTWNLQSDDPTNPSFGCKRFRNVKNFIELIEHLGRNGYTFRQAKLTFPSADHRCYADLVEEEGGVTVPPAPHTVRSWQLVLLGKQKEGTHVVPRHSSPRKLLPKSRRRSPTKVTQQQTPEGIT
jgi:hypothetical protein